MEDGTADSLLVTTANERAPMFSPDGNWIAFVSDETGDDEIHVIAYPHDGRKWQVSRGGGTEPVWSPNGRELFYRTGNAMFAVPVETEAGFKAGTPRRLFESSEYQHNVYGIPNYDVAPDGEGFLMVKRDLDALPQKINVVLNWHEELKRLVPN